MGSLTSIDQAAIFWPVALFNIPLQILTTQIHIHGEVRRGEKGGGGKEAESLSFETIDAEWTAAQWGCAPQVGNATRKPKRAVEANKILHNTQTTDIFVSRFTLHRGYRTIILDNVTYKCYKYNPQCTFHIQSQKHKYEVTNPLSQHSTSYHH